MGNLVTVPAKVPESIKGKTEELWINISKTVRETLSREADKKTRAGVTREFRSSKLEVISKRTRAMIIRKIREEG